MDPKCVAITGKGQRCANRAKYGSFCKMHRHIILDKIDMSSCDDSLVGSLDQYEIGFIADYMSPIGAILMRATCARCILITREEHIRGESDWDGGLPGTRLNNILREAAKYGHRDYCELARELARELGTQCHPLNFHKMLYIAAENGHLDLCELAREWIGDDDAVNFNEVLYSAARGGHRDLCELAREWCAESDNRDRDRAVTILDTRRDEVDVHAVVHHDGYVDQLRFDLIKLRFGRMLFNAARYGHRDICILAHEWISEAQQRLRKNYPGIHLAALDYNEMLLKAAKGGHRDLCILAREWSREWSHEVPSQSLHFDGMIVQAARCADPVRARELCNLAREWIGRAEGTHSIPGAHSAPANAEPAQSGSSSTTGASAPPLNFNMMLRGAAHGGHRNICILAREWAYNWARETQSKVSGNEAKSSDSLNFDIMLWYAAKRNHRDLCELARKWAREWKTQSQSLIKSGVPDYEAFPLNYTGILNDAARMGRQDLCELARELGREAEAPRANFNIMLRVAAEQGHQNICILARKWIDTSGAKVNFNNMLGGAARGGCRDLCILAKKWIDESGAKTNFDAMLGCAAEMGRRNICILAKKWIDEAGATGTRCVPANFNKMLKEAARNGYKSLCILAKKWIDESDSKGVAPLRKAQSTGTRCVPADFNKMLEGAAKGGHRDLCILAREWAREINARHPFSVMLNFDMMRTCRDDIRELAHEWVATCH